MLRPGGFYCFGHGPHSALTGVAHAVNVFWFLSALRTFLRQERKYFIVLNGVL